MTETVHNGFRRRAATWLEASCVENITSLCLKEDPDLKKRFADYLRKVCGIDPECVPVCMSCGGAPVTISYYL